MEFNKESLSHLLDEKHHNPRKKCHQVMQKVDEHLARKCGQKQKHLQPCDEREPCDCTPCGDHQRLTDLVVLIDTSGSMSGKAAAVSAAAEQAIQAAFERCPNNLRVTWLGIEGTFAGTQFTDTYRDYLNNLGVPCAFAASTSNSGSAQGQMEEGADAISDLSRCFDWRENACRSIFYISDEALDQGDPQNVADNVATASAIAAAQAHQVSVFLHLAPGSGASNPATVQNYHDLAAQTGGAAFIGNPPTVGEYTTLLTEAICNACKRCKEVKLPEIKPCMSIAWGDSKCDHIETDDVEILCITLCNCYSNIDFTNVMINYLQVTDMAGNPVPYLPDGTPSVMVVPIGPICFGDIPHCHDNQPTCKSREFVLYTRGARAGTYHLKLGAVCFGVTINQMLNECFEFDLCKS
jgi:hypothetical protein